MGSDFHSNRLAAKASVMDSHGSRLRIQSPRTISTYELSDLPTTRAPYSRATLPVPSQDPWSTTSSSSHGNSISSARPMRNASLCVCHSVREIPARSCSQAAFHEFGEVPPHRNSREKWSPPQLSIFVIGRRPDRQVETPKQKGPQRSSGPE